MSESFAFQQLVDLCRRTHEEMRTRAARTVDLALVARNWLFGWYIVEFEQKGADRAAYGEQLIRRLSVELGTKVGRGFSERNLEQCRKFYGLYQEIPQTTSAQLIPAIRGSKRSFDIPQTVSAELFKRFKNEALNEI